MAEDNNHSDAVYLVRSQYATEPKQVSRDEYLEVMRSVGINASEPKDFKRRGTLGEIQHGSITTPTNPTDPQLQGKTLELLSCPFCGQVPELGTGVLKMFRVTCRAAVCKVWPTTPWYREENVVISVWNTRAAVAGPRGDAATTARNRDEAQDIIMASEEALGQCYDAATRNDLASRITEALDAATSSPTPAESAKHEHRWVGRGDYGGTGSGYMCADCGVDLDDIPTAPTESNSCSHWLEDDSDNCVWCGDDLGPTNVAAPAESTRVEGEQAVKDDVHDWLKEQCSRLLYGQCTTSRCLRRGGYTGGGYSASIATCEAYEVSQALTATTIFSNTRREVETAANEIANRYFGDYPERAYPKLLAILSHYFPSAAAPADNDAESGLVCVCPITPSERCQIHTALVTEGDR